LSKTIVAIVYDGLGEGRIEEDVLATTDAAVVYATDLASPDVRTADALMVTVQPIRTEFITSLERCRIISRVGVGLDNIDIPAATERGIWVVNVPDYAIAEVSTHAIALMLSHMRSVPTWDTRTQVGRWDGQGATAIRRTDELTLGVLGFGRIGSATAAKGCGLGMHVIAHDPYIDPATMTAAGVEPVDWEALLRESDYLSLHVPLTETTRAIMNVDALRLMKPTAYLINTARGGVVDEAALLDALEQHRLAGAALDVLSVEPPPPDHPLLRHERVVVTPHVAWASAEASREVRVKGAEEVVRVLRGERPRCPANEIATPVRAAAERT
jgi:D-3-phosphoglycerate dehydrogenase